MHELSLSSAIVETVERHAQGRPVTAVMMRIGTLRQVVPDSLSFYFEIVSRGTVSEGARLDHEIVPALLRCPDCGTEWDPAPSPVATHAGTADFIPDLPTFRCPECSTGGEVIEGGEFEVEWIEIESGVPTENEEESACIAPR
jgi:hydrogenase nickel incorporation protein HypA/HybF